MRSAPCAAASASARRRLLIGSHIDTVIDAGKYDGPLGVIAGILAVEPFARAKAKLPFGIDVLAFGDEEGSRFPGDHDVVVGLRRRVRARGAGAADADGVTLDRGAAGLWQRSRTILPPPPTGRRTPRLMSRCTSSRGRCWRPRASRSASSPASSARAGCASR